MTAALELFAEHGVGATSYGMIADRLGVTKGAVYHQFKTKDDIIIAVARIFAAEGIEFAYPTQTTYTAAPDGTLVMPWAPPARSG